MWTKYTKTLILLLALLTAAATLLLIRADTVRAYPAGWVSERLLPGLVRDSCDIAVRGNEVHVVAKGADGRIWYTRSLDRGLNWSNWYPLDINPAYEDFDPQVVVGSAGFVWVLWVSAELDGTWYRAQIKRSDDFGSTWSPSLYTWTQDTGCHVAFARLSNSPTGDIQLVYCKTDTGVWEVYFREVPYVGGLGPELSVSPRDGIGSDLPVCCARTTGDYWIAYRDRAADIVCRRRVPGRWYDWGGKTYYPVATHGGDTSFHSPEIANVSSSFTRVVYTAQHTTGYYACQRDCVNETWQPEHLLYGPVTGDPYPKTSCNSPFNVCTHGTDVWAVSAADDLNLMRAALPFGHRLSKALDAGGGHQYCAVASGFAVKVKRTDNAPPSGSAVVDGIPSIPSSATVYKNSDFRISFSDVADDWAITGTDATGDSFTNGVTSISLSYSYSPGAPVDSWHDLPTDVGPLLENAPWEATVKVAQIEEGTSYIRATLTDTAGNRGTVFTGPIHVDRTAPVTTLMTDNRPNKRGWRNSDTTVTLLGSDPNLTGTEYSIEPLSGRRGRGDGLAAYAGPFGMTEGQWKVRYRSRDRAGNIEPCRTAEIKIDTTAPVCAVTRPARDTIQTGYRSAESFRLAGTATDENEVVLAGIYVDGRKHHETTEGFKMSCLWELTGDVIDKQHTLEVRAKDAAGNVGSSAKRVWVGNVSRTWYFPEGNTLPEFDQYICVVNPGDRACRVIYSFMLEDGSSVTAERYMNARQRDTVRVKDYVEEGHHVSTRVHCPEQAVVAECPMYFMYRNAWKGGHNVMGVNILQNEWYFAEGTTRRNPVDGYFEEWICLMNPSEHETANVNITYMLGNGVNIDRSYRVAPHSRHTVEVAADVGVDQDVSARVVSDRPIAAVRTMYFDYHGYAVDGSAVAGATGPATGWFFAEGATHPGFQEWLTIQNPNHVQASCRITYMTGRGRTIDVRKIVPPRARATVDVLNDVGDNEDISARVLSDIPVVCERPMYFIYGAFEGKWWTGGEVAMGNPAPSTQYLLAEGTTITGFDTWYTLQNPNDEGCEVAIEYIFSDGTTQAEKLRVGPHSRTTVRVNDAVRRQADVSGFITAPLPVVLERPVYFRYNDYITGGHNVCGYGID